MKNKLVYLGVTAALMASSLFCFGVNITVGDPNSSGESGTGWYKGGSGPASEVREVEPGMQQDYRWDLQAFSYDYNSRNLSILSGFNQKDGYGNMRLGDLFIDIDGNAVSHPDGYNYDHYEHNSAVYKYDYVVKLDIVNKEYNVYDLRNTTADWVENVIYWNNSHNYNAASDPWRYDLADSRNSAYKWVTKGTLAYSEVNDATADALAELDVGSGYKHYVSTLNNFSWLNPFGDKKLHITMECGNDNMSGVITSVPDGGATILLLGFGMSGLALIRRKRSN